MPYELHWEPGGVYKRFWGKVSFQEYAKSQEQVLGDRRTDDLRYVINDGLAVEGYTCTLEQAEYVAAYNKGTSYSNPRLRVAYVTRDMRLIALVRMLAPLSSLELRVFTSLEEARDWAATLTVE